MLARLNDPGPASFDLLAETARAHDAVLASLAATVPLLPLRLGTVVADEATASRLLEVNEPALRRELGRVEGHAEWAVTVRTNGGQPGEGDPGDGAHRAATSGREYLEARRSALRERKPRRAQHQEAAGEIHEALAARATDAQRVTDRPVEEVSPTPSPWRLPGPPLGGGGIPGHGPGVGAAAALGRRSRVGALPPLPLHEPEPDGRPPVSAGAAEGPAYGPERVDLSRTDPDGDDATVVDLLDRLLEGGVMIHGDVTLSLAGIDLLYVGLRLVVKVPDDGPGP